MTALADAVLPLIRTRAELWRWSTTNDHGAQMHDGIDILESALPTTDPAEPYTVTHKALASANTVIARAGDSSGIIGDACRRLLALHPRVATAAKVPTAKLIDWMIKFHFDGDVDGGFNWSSQHLDDGGVVWPSSRKRNVLVGGGSGRLIVRYGRRCGHRGGPSRRGRCSASFGG